MRNLNVLASLCSRGDWFKSCFVGNPKDRFCLIEAQIITAKASFCDAKIQVRCANTGKCQFRLPQKGEIVGYT